MHDVAKEPDTHFAGDLYIGEDTLIDQDALSPNELWDVTLLRSCAALERFRKRHALRNNLGDPAWGDLILEYGDLFGADTKITMSKFLRFAVDPPKKALPMYVAPRMMFLDFARRILTKRTAR